MRTRTISFSSNVSRDALISLIPLSRFPQTRARPGIWYSDDRLPSKLERPRAETSWGKRLIGSIAPLSRSEKAAGTI